MAGRSVVVYEQTDKKEEVVIKVIERIRWDAEGRTPKLILFFSTNLRFYYYASRLNEEFPDSVVVGAVSGSILSSDGIGDNGLSAIAIFEGIECEAGMIHDISKYPMKYAAEVTENAKKLSTTENTICLEFTTALLNAEELIMDTLLVGLKGMDIPIIGSSTAASDGNIMTYVSLNGQVYSEGCVYLLIHNNNGRIGVFKENMYKPTGFEFTVTDVDCDDRLIYEFDNRQAAGFLSDKLSMKRDMLPEYLHMHPLGRYIDKDIYITAVDSIEKNGALSCHARVYNRTKFALMEPDNYKEVWDRTAWCIREKYENISFSILINCNARTEIFKEEGILSDFSNKLIDAYGAYIGVSGMGEQFMGVHTNQTMVLAVFE